MFILSLIIPLLPLSLIWHRFDIKSRRLLRFIFCVAFSLFFTSYYLNGMDWSIYYLKFIDREEAYSSFEFGFVLLFNFLLFITDNNFGLSILIFYLICFGLLTLILKRFIMDEPLFWICLFLVFGYNLILEQLRQFLACIIVVYSVLKYNEEKKSWKLILWTLIAASFHVSSLIIIPAVVLTSFRSVNLFITSSLISIIGFVLVLFAGYAIISSFAQLNFVFAKLAYYLQQNPISFNFGWLNILDLIFVFFYLYYRHYIDSIAPIQILTRMIFVGALIHLFSGAITFLSRVSFYFYFFAIYSYCFSVKNDTKRFFAIKDYNTLILSCFFALVLFFNYGSYFRNSSAPIAFSNFNLRFISFFDDSYVRKLANEKLLVALKDHNGSL